jgi:neutral ceramidase
MTIGRLAPVLALALVLPACSTWHAQPLPTTASRPVSGTGQLRAGFARVDITPPPGVGLAGSGPEGRRSTGYRTRLYIGALVLEDASGERLALLVGDLPHVTANLHRLAAARLVDGTGIGADRLIVSATHTHSGPAHFYGERQYNQNASRVSGYDPRIVDTLVGAIVLAVERATAALTPAVLAWGETTVPGATTNRSVAAFCRNPEADSLCTDGRTRDSTLAVDPRLVLLRVDALDALGDRRPLGSYSIFALHGTAIPSVNTALDGDAHARIVARMIRADSPGAPVVHLLANGAEGDVSPAIQRDRCETPRLGLGEPTTAPHGPGESVDFLEPPAHDVDRCLEDALDDVDSIAAAVADRAFALYRDLEGALRPDVEIRRAFTTEWLPGRDGLCGSPELGSATAAGAELLETRVSGWRWLLPGVRLGIEEGGLAVRRRDGKCQSPKLPLLEPFQSTVIVGEHGFPEVAQLTVAKVGTMLLAALPAEVTTVAGARMRRELEQAASDGGLGTTSAAIVGLANGFVQYVTTREEYQAQQYEGGSNLYGPGSAEFYQRRLRELVARLPAAGGGASPPAEVGPITAYPGPAKAILEVGARRVPVPDTPIKLRCEDGLLTGELVDQPPGIVLASGRPWIAIERESGDGWARVAEDGDGRVELYAAGRKSGAQRWRVVWRRVAESGRYRLVRIGDPSGPERVGGATACHPSLRSG